MVKKKFSKARCEKIKKLYVSFKDIHKRRGGQKKRLERLGNKLKSKCSVRDLRKLK